MIADRCDRCGYPLLMPGDFRREDMPGDVDLVCDRCWLVESLVAAATDAPVSSGVAFPAMTPEEPAPDVEPNPDIEPDEPAPADDEPDA